VSLSLSSLRRPVVGGSKAQNARTPWPIRDAKRLDSYRLRLDNVGARLAKRSKLTRSLMTACNFGRISVANVERGTSEGKPSMHRVRCSLLDRVSAQEMSLPRLYHPRACTCPFWGRELASGRRYYNESPHIACSAGRYNTRELPTASGRNTPHPCCTVLCEILPSRISSPPPSFVCVRLWIERRAGWKK
jgi:hypothetical protein